MINILRDHPAAWRKSPLMIGLISSDSALKPPHSEPEAGLL